MRAEKSSKKLGGSMTFRGLIMQIAVVIAILLLAGLIVGQKFPRLAEYFNGSSGAPSTGDIAAIAPSGDGSIFLMVHQYPWGDTKAILGHRAGCKEDAVSVGDQVVLTPTGNPAMPFQATPLKCAGGQ